MSSSSNNIAKADQPVTDSNQLVEASDKRFFYEEIRIASDEPNPEDGKWFIFDMIGVGGAGQTAEVYLVKEGRRVTMYMDGIIFLSPNVTQPITLSSASTVIPPRFRPIKMNNTAFSHTDFEITTFLGLTQNDGLCPGVLEIYNNGTFQIKRLVGGQYSSFPAVGTDNVGTHRFQASWLTASSYNKE